MIKLKINALYRTYLNQYVIIKSFYKHSNHNNQPLFIFIGINMNKEYPNSKEKYFESGLSYFHLEADIIEEISNNHLVKLLGRI